MASKTMLVAQREFLENVRTKTFWIGIIIVPVLIAASIGLGTLLSKFKEVQQYAVVDLGDGSLAERTEREFRAGDAKVMFELLAQIREDAQTEKGQQALRELAEEFEGMRPGDEPTGEQMLVILDWMSKQSPELLAKFEGISASKRYAHRSLDSLDLADRSPQEQQEALNKLVGDDKLFAYFVLGDRPLETFDGFRYVSNNLTDDALRDAYQNTLTNLIQKDRIQAADIDEQVAKHIQARVAFEQKKVSETGDAEEVEAEDKASQWAPIGFVYFLWIAIFSIANLLLTNTIEEKSNRIIEVLLSSVSPSQLMHGKIYGIAFTGLTIVGTWVFFALIAAEVAPALLGEGGGGLKVMVAAIGNTKYLTSFVLYFVAGYLLYAAVLVAIGSVCNTLKEAQNLMQPVVILLMVPLISMVFVTQEPNGMVAKVLSYVPLFTPFTMMNRAAGPPETWEYVVTTIVLVATILIAFKAAGKVFRVGVLMTGNPPKLKEIWGWLWKGYVTTDGPQVPDGRLLLVGGGQGIGRAIAAAFADRCTIWTRKNGVDAQDEHAVRDAYLSFEKLHGAPYALIHTIGDFVEQPLLETTEHTYRHLFQSNVDTVFQTVQAVVPAMVEAGRGRVILFAAAGADRQRAMLRAPVYFAAKAAVIQLARSLAVEVAPAGVTVNVIAPGLIDHEHSHRESQARMLPRVPAGRVGSAADVVPLVRYLLAQEASYVTGQVLTVDGGLQS